MGSVKEDEKHGSNPDEVTLPRIKIVVIKNNPTRRNQDEWNNRKDRRETGC